MSDYSMTINQEGGLKYSLTYQNGLTLFDSDVCLTKVRVYLKTKQKVRVNTVLKIRVGTRQKNWWK